MDPTKSFDHLDPKLKETYARVMGTDTGSSGSAPAPAATTPTTQPIQEPSLSSSPFGQPDQSPAAQPQLGSSPFTQPASQAPDTSLGPNPGTGPTINTLPPDTTSSFTPTPATPQVPSEPPSGPSFFSNTTPAAPTGMDQEQVTDQYAAAPTEPSADPTPITPYSPEDLGAAQSPIATEPLTQPLPSPSSVNQESQHETSALLKVLYIVGSVIFFIVYTFFWIKVFNLPVPFLPF